MGVTSVRLQPEIEHGLDAVARRQRRSKSWLINQALREYMAREASESERWEESLVAMDEVANGEVVSGESVHAWLKSWGSPAEAKAPKARR